MKIGIYQQTTGAIGGSEFLTAAMANSLRADHDVEIVHHDESFCLENCTRYYGLDLTGVTSRYSSDRPAGLYGLNRFLPPSARRWRHWNAGLSDRYDLFVANVHYLPPHCHATRGVLNVLFPLFVRGQAWPSVPPRAGFKGLIDAARLKSFEADWPVRFSSYQTKLAISRFAADHTAKRWGVTCDVLYPPAPGTERTVAPKEKRIVSLARFNPWKQQSEMLAAFKTLILPRVPDWELVFVGGLSDTPEGAEYYTQLQDDAAGFPVRFVPNAPRSVVEDELARASIFWHVMGLGFVESDPLRVEHFGIATVEGMAAGCVPVVLDAGGQAEIVLHGECGFTAATIEAMADHIVALTADAPTRGRLSEQARTRAADFSLGNFARRMRQELGLTHE